jgi:hypothetical protein
MARGRGPGIEDDERYEMLGEEGTNKEVAARIANAERRSKTKRPRTRTHPGVSRKSVPKSSSIGDAPEWTRTSPSAIAGGSRSGRVLDVMHLGV